MYFTLKGKLMSDPFHTFAFGKWETVNGQLKFTPLHSFGWKNHFAVHFTPIYFFIVPLYLIFDGPLFLLYLQVLAVGLSTIPLYLIAKNVFRERYISIIIAIVYLVYRHLLIGLMYDFHIEMFFPLFLFSSYYFLAIKKKPFLYFLFIALALFIKEDIGIYIFFFGVFLFFKLKENRKYGLITSLLSLSYLFLTFFVIIPYFRGKEGLIGSYEFLLRWQELGDNSWEIIFNMLIHPGVVLKSLPIGLILKKFSNIVFPLLLIPFFSLYILLIFPPLIVLILSKSPQMYTFGIHYSATIIPFLFISLVYGLKNLEKFFYKINKKKIFYVILSLLLIVNLANTKWNLLRISRYSAIKDYKTVKEIINSIPHDASISALSSLIPHIPKRENIYMLPQINNAEYILVHTAINLWPYKKEEFHNFLRKINQEKKYKCIVQKGKMRLFKRID
jgi:uncharacterized membrane protein